MIIIFKMQFLALNNPSGVVNMFSKRNQTKPLSISIQFWHIGLTLLAVVALPL